MIARRRKHSKRRLGGTFVGADDEFSEGEATERPLAEDCNGNCHSEENDKFLRPLSPRSLARNPLRSLLRPKRTLQSLLNGSNDLQSSGGRRSHHQGRKVPIPFWIVWCGIFLLFYRNIYVSMDRIISIDTTTSSSSTLPRVQYDTKNRFYQAFTGWTILPGMGRNMEPVVRFRSLSSESLSNTRQSQQSPVAVPKTRHFKRATVPWQGEFHYRSLQKSTTFQRTIPTHDHAVYHKERRQLLDDMDEEMEDNAKKFDHYEEQDYPHTTGCYRPHWSYEVKPLCNRFHEFQLVGGLSESPLSDLSVKYLAAGYFRETWLLTNEQLGSTVLKSLRFNDRRKFTKFAYNMNNIEAVSMLQTSYSNRTMDIHGACGTSILVEKGIPIDKKLLPHKVYNISQKELEKEQVHDVKPRNPFSPEEKLEMALAMAESLAVLHGNPAGVLMQDDISVSQWLIGTDGNLKLNDFGNGFAMEWNIEKQEYCTFRKTYFSVYRAPEELTGKKGSTEAAEVCAFGKIIYTLLTGLVPYYSYPDKDSAVDAIIEGEMPYIDSRYRTRSFIEGRLVEIMEKIIPHNPKDRADIFTVVEFLRETMELSKKNATLVRSVG